MKIIPILVAAFCGFAIEFQAAAANAQAGPAYVTTGTQLNPGWGFCTANNYCLWMLNDGWDDGTAGLFDPNGNLLWQSSQNCGNAPYEYGYLGFQNDGNLVVYSDNQGAYGSPCVDFAANTYAGNTITGDPGAYLVIEPYGLLVVYDANWYELWNNIDGNPCPCE
jgi:hypothetical protein